MGCLLLGRFQCMGYDYMAYVDYMDLDIRCPRNLVNHSIISPTSFVTVCCGLSPFSEFLKHILFTPAIIL